MKCERIPLGAQGAYLDTYFLADSPELKAGACRPAVVVCPGGGYAYTSDREAEPIALALCARGFHACVLRYPCAPARFPAALRALAEAVAWVRAGAAENHVDPRQISVCGFSAGGHGLSLANELTENTAGAGVQAECTGWVDLAAGWLRR